MAAQLVSRDSVLARKIAPDGLLALLLLPNRDQEGAAQARQVPLWGQDGLYNKLD